MAVPTSINDLSVVVGSNVPTSSEAIGTSLDDHIRAIASILKEAGATLYTATGTNTITFSTTPTFSSYVSGQRFWIKAAGANTGAVTINVNSLGAKNVYKSGATALGAGDIPAANACFCVVYDGTQFQILDPVLALFGAGTVSLPALTLNGDTDSGLYQIGANNYGVAMNGAKVLDIATTGLAVTGTTSTTTGMAVGGATAGAGGIAFPATAVSVADVNTLDDYEEGTFSPGISFGGGTTGITYALQSGSYTKIGNRVFCTGKVELTAKGSSAGDALITGLPFTIANSNDALSAAGLRLADISFADFPQAYGIAATTTIALEEITNAGTRTTLVDTNFANSSFVTFSFNYRV